MKAISGWLWAFGMSLFCLACTAQAQTTEDIIQLAQKGLGEEVLLATVERTEGGFALTADQIVKLKQAGVSEKVIAAMLRKAPAAPVAAQPTPAAPTAPVQAAAVGEGTLNLENVDDKPWAYRLDETARLLWISPLGAAAEERVLPAHGGVSLAAAAGAYEVRYAGEASSTPFSIQANEKTLLLVSRVETEEFEGLYVSVFEKAERKAGGRLAVLRQTRRSPPQVTYQYVAPQPVQRVESQQVVVEPSTTVVYRNDPYWDTPTYVYQPLWWHPPVYYSGYSPYYRPYYGSSWGRSCYYPSSSVGFRYLHGGRRSGWSVGFGFGF